MTKLAIFISGSGRTLENLLKYKFLNKITIDLVISSTSKAYGLNYAKQNHIPYIVINPNDYTNYDDFVNANFKECDKYGIDLICLAGYLKKLSPVPPKWINRILNIHPSLLPKYGGKGCYGIKVHQKVVDAKEKLSGCTVHLVDDKYDHGKIISQDVIFVNESSPDELAKKVFEKELILYPRTIDLYVSKINHEARRS